MREAGILGGRGADGVDKSGESASAHPDALRRPLS
jgi:hypothetical protein